MIESLRDLDAEQISLPREEMESLMEEREFFMVEFMLLKPRAIEFPNDNMVVPIVLSPLNIALEFFSICEYNLSMREQIVVTVVFIFSDRAEMLFTMLRDRLSSSTL